MADTKGPVGSKASFNKLEETLNEYLAKKAPALPENVKETLVSFGPYLAIIGIVISIPAILALLGLGALGGSFSAFMGPAYGMRYGFGYIVGLVGSVVTIVLEAMAIQGLFKRSMGAWRLMYYSSLVTILSGILQGSVFGAIIGGIISLYILFQLKSKYK